MALRPVLLASALGLLAVGASAAPEPAAAPPVPPRIGVHNLDVDLKVTEGRLAQLVRLAKMRKQELMIRAYTQYTEAQLIDKKREVRAKDLWEIVEDPKKELADAPLIREAAADALAKTANAHEFDPDLSLDPARSGGGRKRPRAALCLEITPHLKGKDRLLRALAHKVLSGLFQGGGSDPDIQTYNPDDRKTWQPAIERWERILNRRP